MKLNPYFVYLFLFIHFFLFLQAQKYSFKNYTVANGLGAASVNHIFQDSKGYIWFATQGGGASRFNGKEFKNFSKAEGLINNDVTYITEDRNGNIWIGTASGASEFDGISFFNYGGTEGLTDGVVYSIHADEQNKIWLATQDRGVKIFNRGNFDSVTITNGLPSNEIYSIVEDKAGSLWFGLSDGIVKFSHGEVTPYSDSAFIADQAFFAGFLDDKGSVWFGSTSGMVLSIQPNGTLHHVELPPALQSDFIGGIAGDKQRNIWLATDHGILKYTGKDLKLFGEHEGLSVNIAQTVMCDYEGNIWAGTLGGGVNLLSSEAFVHYADKDGLTSKNVTCVFSGYGDSSYYIGTDGGLYFFKPTENVPLKKITDVPEIKNANLISISRDKRGHFWVCTQEGVLVLERKNREFRLLTKYIHLAGEQIISPTQIIHDSNGNCWIATYGSGLFCLTPSLSFEEGRGKAKSFNTKNGFPSDKVLTLFEDARSNLWIGTQDAGIIKYDGQYFTPLARREAEGEAVWSITEDERGNIYWGTGESGLCRYDGKNITTYTTGDGLSSNFITALAWDKNENYLWLGSEKGLDKLKFSADYQIEKVHAYKETDGFNPVSINQNAIQIDEEGLVWLGTVNGLWLFNRQHDFPKNVPPKIQLTGIRLFFQKTHWQNFADTIDSRSHLPVGLMLPYNKNHLTFDIQALTTQDVQYVYMLEGQDADWSAPVQNREITYSNISPGQAYTFKAKAVTDEGTGSDETILFSFIIKPPWWSTWWFRVLALLALVASLMAFVKTRERVLKEQNVRLEETVRQRTFEIEKQKEVVEKTLTEKEGLLHEKEILLKEIHHRVKNNLQTISSMLMLQSAGIKDEQARKAITESQSRVRSIALVHQKLYQTDGLEKVELNAFVKDLAEQIRTLFPYQSKTITINRNIPETYILIDTAIPLGLILNELLTNSFKYAFQEQENGEIKIELKFFDENLPDHPLAKKVTLSYFDNGPGLEKAEALENASTLGLRLIRLLSRQIGASLDYTSEKGSEFLFTFEHLETFF